MRDEQRRPTDDPLSEEELAELEGLESEATAAPWWYDEGELYYRLHGTGGWTPEQGSGEFKIPSQPLNRQILKAAKQSEVFEPYWPLGSDAVLIPKMRNALPRLLREVRELRELATHDAVRLVIEARAELADARRRLEAYEAWARQAPVQSGDAPRQEREVVEDGFGGGWAKCGPDCRLQVVRPGKVQCDCDAFLD